MLLIFTRFCTPYFCQILYPLFLPDFVPLILCQILTPYFCPILYPLFLPDFVLLIFTRFCTPYFCQILTPYFCPILYPLFLPDFNKTSHFLDKFSKNLLVSNFIKIRPVGDKRFHADWQTQGQTDRQTHTDRRTDMKKPTVADSYLSNVSNKTAISYSVLTLQTVKQTGHTLTARYVN